jgi:hypothetical protein
MSNKLSVPKNSPKEKAPNKKTNPVKGKGSAQKGNSLNLPKPGY